MRRKSSNLIESLLFVWKDELLKEYNDEVIIPFVFKKDINAFKHRNKEKKQIHSFGMLMLGLLKFLIYTIFLIDETVSTKEIEAYLKNQKHYFNLLIASYSLKDISIKPTRYDLLIYLYYITCPHLILGDCYVLIEDSLTLKQSFTFLGKPSFDDLEENEKKNQ